MTEEELKRLIAQGEGLTLEFKSRIPTPDIIAKHVSAFANTQGGIVLFGIEEPNRIVGIEKDRLSKAVEKAQSVVSPMVWTELDFTDVEDKTVGILSIRPSDGPITTQGGYYQRDGESVRAMTGEEIRTRLVSSKSPDAALIELSNVVAQQTQVIEKLRIDFEKANSPVKKILLALGGAAGGAILKFVIERLLS